MIPQSAKETLTTDRLDRQLIHALVVDGRASFRRLAEVLGTSEQTVARRYRRLREARAIRVIALPSPERFDQHWFVRVRVRPSAGVAVAEALAQRPETSWVGLTAAGTEVTFTARAHSSQERDALLLERLPRSSHVLDVSGASVLHTFTGGPETEWRALDDPLEPAQNAALIGEPRPRSSGSAATPEDGPLLAALARDGRATYAALAGQTGDTEARVARRVEALLASGAIIIDIELATELLGYKSSAWLWMSVAPMDIDAVGREVARHPEVPFVGAMSGPANVAASVTTRDTASLYRYVTQRIGVIDAVRSLEVAPVLRRFKRANTIMEGIRLPAPS